MKAFFLSIAVFLASSLRISPEYAETISIKDTSEIVTSFNQEVTEYTINPDLKILKASSNSNGNVNWWEYPENMKPATRDGDDLLVLVNKEYYLPDDYVPSDLVSASLSGIRRGSSYQLRNILIPDLTQMVNDAKNDGVDLSIVSGYRSYSTQVATWNYWKGINGVAGADKISARAGHSQHQLGTAIDFSTNEINDGLSGSFAGTHAASWLAANAWKYGFVISYPQGYETVTGYSYEAWHYRYIGKANAQEMHDSGMIEEIYLQTKN